MSRHFDANQYERSFRPQCLRNWEVVRRYPNERPRARRGHTKIIADDRGHLLPGVPRIEPWCHFRSTWQLPKRITRKLARDINTIRPSGKHLTSWEKRSYHSPLFDKNQAIRLPSATGEKLKNPGKKEIPIVQEKEVPSEEEHEGDYSLPVAACRNPKVINTSQRARKDYESYQKAAHQDSPKKETSLETPLMSPKRSPKSVGSEESIVVKNASEADFVSSKVAKSLAQNNLKHKPLPDAVLNKAFQSRQMMKDSQPKLASEVPLNATAVGQRKYKSPGPTQCSKLNVFRPRTSISQKADPSKFTDKATFEKQLGPIDLAICWDLTSGAHEEPRRPLHIDGTNDVAGPSIFNIVRTPRDDGSDSGHGQEESRSGPKTAWVDKPVNPSAVMDIINNNAEITGKVDSNKGNDLRNGNDRKSNGSSRRSSKDSLENRNPNIARNGGEDKTHNSASSLDSEKLSKVKHYRSSPNLSTCGVENSKSKQKMLFSRPCMACETKEVQSSDSVRRPKSDYKMAFKAGVPNHSNNPSSRSENGNRPLTGRHQVSVPRPKTPFAKKNYAINSLAPPFSLWPGTTGMDYPEHWRLASVYQHSYKPIELRKKPFLQGVYH